MRLDKYLADMTPFSRKEIKSDIRQGLVKVNGLTANDPGLHVDENDEVIYRGEQVGYSPFVYYMLNKPAGVVSATEDRDHKTVIDLINKNDNRKGLFPIGRLDIDTVGLLILTDDGDLAHSILSPKKHFAKKYLAKVEGRITSETAELFSRGMDLGDFTTMPAELEIVDDTTAYVTICEGKFHQVKRMFHACGSEVIYLKRVSMGKLVLDEALAEGEYRPLTDEELELLK